MVALAEWIEKEESAVADPFLRLGETATPSKNRVGDFLGRPPDRVGDLGSQVVERVGFLVVVELRPRQAPSLARSPQDPTNADGYLSLEEANEHYRRKEYDIPANVDATKLKFPGLDPAGFDFKTGRQTYTFPKFDGKTPNEDFLVHGTVTLERNETGTGFRVLSGEYNFEMHPVRSWNDFGTMARNAATNAGFIYAVQGRIWAYDQNDGYMINYENEVPLNQQ